MDCKMHENAATCEKQAEETRALLICSISLVLAPEHRRQNHRLDRAPDNARELRLGNGTRPEGRQNREGALEATYSRVFSLRS